MELIQQQKARALQDLNKDGTYVLPNAWDAGSAVLIARAGAPVIATTSAGVSWALGRPDGQNITREQALAVIAQIVDAVEVPVTGDIEGGYGDITETVTDLVAAGAVGVNIEDSGAPDGALFGIAEQAARLAAARIAATDLGLPELAINARTDTYLFAIGEPEHRYDDTIRRAHAFAEAGADTLFVPGVADLNVIENLVRDSPIPINIMTGPGGPTVSELTGLGVRRVSFGPAIAWAAYSLAVRAAREILTAGTYTEISDLEPWDAINGAFTTR